MSDRMPLIGPEIMAIITTGLYDNPLAMYREYIQNSADAIEESQSASLHVDVHIEAGNGRVTIRDNGPGLSYTDARGALLPVAMSQKSGDTDRGFRGIGRLAALAFSDSVSFATRTHSKEDVTRITWNGGRLRANLISRLETERTIRESVDVRCVGGECYPNHFFEVEIVGVKRHAAGLVLNPDIVRSYISEVCPVPLSSSFPFASRIGDLFKRSDTPFALEITVNGMSSITRPYGSRIMLVAEWRMTTANWRRFKFHPWTVARPQLSGGLRIRRIWGRYRREAGCDVFGRAQGIFRLATKTYSIVSFQKNGSIVGV